MPPAHGLRLLLSPWSASGQVPLADGHNAHVCIHVRLRPVRVHHLVSQRHAAPLIDLRNKQDASIWSRSRKLRACDRVDALPLWAAERAVLRLLVKRARGDRNRCALSHDHIAELIHRSGTIRGDRGTIYSTQHIRVCLRRLEQVGFVRWTRLLPGDRFPSKDYNVDGAGDEVVVGCCVFEVNMPALLGDAPVWGARRRRPGLGGRRRRGQPTAAEEVREAVEELAALATHAAAASPPNAAPSSEPVVDLGAEPRRTPEPPRSVDEAEAPVALLDNVPPPLPRLPPRRLD